MRSAIVYRLPRHSKSSRETIAALRLSPLAGTLHFQPMRIPSIEVARASQAYGLRLTHQSPISKPATPTVPVTRAPDQLIAASVSQPVSFDALAQANSAPQAALQLYTRAADKLEVAIALQVGRTIDRTG